MALFLWQLDLVHQNMPSCLQWRAHKMHGVAPWGGQMSWINQNDTGSGATVSLALCRHSGGSVPQREVLGTLWREDTHVFHHFGLRRVRNESLWASPEKYLISLFERKCFQFYKGLSFILRKKGMIRAYTFCKTPKGGIPESLPLRIDYWEIPWREAEKEAGTIGTDPEETSSSAL